jgi:hypothetical protein
VDEGVAEDMMGMAVDKLALDWYWTGEGECKL